MSALALIFNKAIMNNNWIPIFYFEDCQLLNNYIQFIKIQHIMYFMYIYLYTHVNIIQQKH